MIKMYFGLHVNYRLFLSYFNETSMFSTKFRNFANTREGRPSVRGHEKRGIKRRNALFYRKIFDMIRTCQNRLNDVK